MEKRQMKTGIFGGTFDPVHNGHVRAASEFLRQASLDRLYIIPDRIPPHKSIGAGDDPAMRLMMTRLAFSASPEFSGRAVVSDMEVKSEGKSYTYLTLKRFVDMGFSGLYLYCGTDMLLTFDEWYRFEDILSLCTIAYAARERQTSELALRVAEKKTLLKDRYGAKILDISFDPVEISSSEVRQMIHEGRDASAYLPHPVYEYIKEKNLYR
jgi:nicotinate-nucleotide adenylyltransferase